MTQERKEIYEALKGSIKETIEEMNELKDKSDNPIEKALIIDQRRFWWKFYEKLDKLAFAERMT